MSDTRASVEVVGTDNSGGAFRTAEQNLKGFEATTKTVSKALKGFGALAVVREIERLGAVVLQQVGTYERLKASIAEVSRATNGQSVAQERLYAFAQRTGIAFDVVVEKYLAADRAAKAAGESQREATLEALRLLESQAASVGVIEQANNRLGNAITNVLGAIADSSGATAGFAQHTSEIAKNLDSIAKVVKEPKFQEIMGKIFLASGTVQAARFAVNIPGAITGLLRGNATDDEATGHGFRTGGSFGAESEFGAPLEKLGEIQLAAHKKRQPIGIGIGTGETPTEAFEQMAAAATAAAAKAREQSDAIRDRIADNFEAVRQGLLNESQVEAEATANRLAILHDALEQKLISKQRYTQLETEVTRRGAEAQLRIAQNAVAKERQLSAQKLENVRGLTSAVAAALTAGGENSKKDFEQHKKIARAAAIIDTAAAAALALRSHPGLPGIIEAAAIAAYGLAQVRTINATTWSGGGDGSIGGAGGGGGAGGTSGAPEPRLLERDSARDRVLIDLSGAHIVGPGGLDELGELLGKAISRHVNDRDVIIIKRNSVQAREIRGGS